MKLTYLACPYNDPDPKVREERFHAVNREAARLMQLGEFIYSPISHNHPIAEAHGLPKGWDFWEPYDTAFLESCRLLIVLKLPGWENSKGVKAEMEIAQKLGIPIEFSHPQP